MIRRQQFLMILLLLALAVPLTAFAETFTLTDSTVYQSVSDGEYVYLLTDAGAMVSTADGDVQHYSSVPVITDVTMQAYAQMDADDKTMAESGITHMLMGDDGLWGINAYAGLAARIDTDGVHFLDVAFDTSEWFAEDTCPIDTSISGFVEDETVYILTTNALQVWHTDTATEQKISIKATVLQCVPYKAHQALLNIMTSNGDWNTALYVLDLDTWQLQALDIELPEMASSSDGVSMTQVAYNAADDRLVTQVGGNDFAEDGMLLESVGGTAWEKLATVHSIGSMYLLNGGSIMWIQNGQAAVYVLSTLGNAQITLEIKGLLHQDASAYQNFTANHPGLELRKTLSDLSSSDVDALVNHASTPDAFALYGNQLYQDIVRKGYALVLDDAGVADLLDDMHPLYRSMLRNDAGQLVALPTMVSVNLVMVDQELWRETFGEDTPYPVTYRELFMLMMDWEEHYSDAYADVNMTDDWDLRALLSRMIEQYILAYESDDGQLSFDTPVFMETMETFADLLNGMDQTRFEQNAKQGSETLFSTCNLTNLFHMDDETIILQPFQMDASNTAIRADVVVLVGNGFTQHPKETEALVEQLAQKESLSIETQYALFSSCNQPVTYTAGKKERTITAKGIAAYQSMLPYIKLSADSNYLSQSDSESSFTSSIEDNIDQLVAGKITVDQFVKQIDRVASMLWMESQ
ncbi:MAG: hypothetical protein Q4B32_09475 [Clostridia bacterium]|nr:hypothetical protein [Clostridia bacterium]